MDQEIRFATARDGTRLAYAVHGNGPPLVRAANWLTHLEYDWQCPVWRHWLDGLGQVFRVTRYDERGCGLSDREIGTPELDDFVGDLEAVVDAAGLTEFDLLGTSQGGAVATAFAARHPERVRRLVVYGGYARGRLRRGPSGEADADLLRSLIEHGWDRPNPAFRRVFSTLFAPDAPAAHLVAIEELMRASLTAADAIRLRDAFDRIDVSELAALVRAPALVVHPRDDGIVPFEEGLRLAALIPGARFEPLAGRNHLMLESEPAWPRFLGLVRSFLGVETGADPAVHESAGDRALDGLSEREREILARVAAGRSNLEIAEELVISPRTVERHLSNVYDKLGITGKAARAAAAALAADAAHHTKD